MGDEALRRVEEGFAQGGHHPFGAALHDAAHRILRGGRLAQEVVEARRVGAAADLDDLRREADALPEHLLGHDARGHQPQRDAPREVASAARVVEPAEFADGRQVGVRGR